VLVGCFNEKEGELWLDKLVASAELGSTAVPKCKKQYAGRLSST
jgi:hypothetical protein